MVNGVLMDAGGSGDHLPHGTPDASYEARGAGPRFMARIVRENTAEVAVINGWILEIITLALAFVMFLQRHLQHRKRLDFRARAVPWFRACEFFHQLVNVFQLLQRRPALI